MGLFFFIPFALHVFDNDRDAAHVFLRLAFIYRSLMMDDARLAAIEQAVDLQQEIYKYQEHLEEAYEDPKSSYNTHLLSHSLHNRRRTGPLYQTSTEKYEDVYGTSRHNYYAGTQNQGLQIIENQLCGLQGGIHICPRLKKLKISAKTRSQVDDSVVFIREVPYRVLSVSEDKTTFEGQRIGTQPFSSAHLSLPLP